MMKIFGVMNILGAGMQFILALQGGQDYRYSVAIICLALGLVLINESD